MAGITYNLTRDDEEYELDVSYRMTYGGCPARGPTYSCGGTPPEAAEFEVDAVTLYGKPFALTDAEQEALYDFIAENDTSEADAEADYADRRYDEMRDER